MAVEARRGCGYRKVGGLYLVGQGLTVPCDRLPLPIEPCPVCGEQPRFSRGIARIDPLKLWGEHQNCTDPTVCPVCHPAHKAWLMWVGKEYTPESFIAEARAMGVSKRVHQVPKDLVIGEDWVWLAYLHLIPGKGQFRLLGGQDGKRPRDMGPGIFYVFKPTHLEKIVTESQAQDQEAMDKLKEQGITPVVVPDDDPDHNPRAARRTRSLV